MHRVVDAIRTRYGVEYGVMKEMGWSWPDLCAAPVDLVEEIVTRLQADRKWEHERRRRDDAAAKAKSSRGKH